MAEASSTSYADVLTAYNATDEGETLTIPSGASEWSDTLTITKGITVQGAGKTSTVITADEDSLILMNINPGSNKAVRITGIGFTDGKYIYITGNTTNSYVLDQIRIDHCKFFRDT